MAIKHRILIAKSLRHTNLILNHKGFLSKDIIGKYNTVEIKKGSRVNHLKIRIRGNNNTLVINNNCVFGTECSIWMEGDGIRVIIGEGCTFTTRCHINAQENGSIIDIGSDCMFSNHIIVRTSDSHPIYNLGTNQRINEPEPVEIGDHVWIAPNTKIMKGAVIPNGSIIGSDTTVSKKFTETNTLIVGRPAKVVRCNVNWTREKLF